MTISEIVEATHGIMDTSNNAFTRNALENYQESLMIPGEDKMCEGSTSPVGCKNYDIQEEKEGADTKDPVGEEKKEVADKEDPVGEKGKAEADRKDPVGVEQSVTSGIPNIMRAVEEAKQGWYASEGGKVEQGGCGAVVKVEEILELPLGFIEKYNDRDFNHESEREGGHMLIDFQKHYICPSDPALQSMNVSGEQGTAVLIEGIQRSSEIASSPSSIRPPSSSIMPFQSSFQNPSDSTTYMWSRAMSSVTPDEQSITSTDDSDPGRYGPGNSFLSETKVEDVRPVHSLFNEGLLKEALPHTVGTEGSCLIRDSHLETITLESIQPLSYDDYTHMMDSAIRDIYATESLGLGCVQGRSKHERKASTADSSLRRVLSDSLSGLLMDDAMVAQCGHSFGISSLQRVMNMNLCLICGVSISPGSLIPNYALRSAVQAYKKEGHFGSNAIKGCKRRREHAQQVENSEGKKISFGTTENTSIDMSRLKGVQFPFVVNDRVLIKGNKRTPGRFVGREAIITTQCLNGWYLVRTLDNGESVRLQYRSLQKLGSQQLTNPSQLKECLGETWM